MLTINILPSGVKKEISAKKTLKILTKFSLMFLMLTITITGITFISKLFLKSHLETIDESVSINKGGKNFDGEIKKIEEQLKNITQIQKEHINCPKIIENIIVKTDDDISISQLKIDLIKNEIFMSGHAKNRNSLLDLKNKLEDSQIYSNIELPLDNLLEKTNINFNIKMNFKIQ